MNIPKTASSSVPLGAPVAVRTSGIHRERLSKGAAAGIEESNYLDLARRIGVGNVDKTTSFEQRISPSVSVSSLSIAKFFTAWENTEKKTAMFENSLPVQYRDLCKAQRSLHLLGLQTHLVEKLAEAFTGAVKSLQRAGAG